MHPFFSQGLWTFSGRLPISTSLSCSSGVFLYFFIWNIFFCCITLCNFLCLWYHRMQDCSTSCFWCTPPGRWNWSKRFGKASWCKGLLSGHWRVELGLVPLMGRGVWVLCFDVFGKPFWGWLALCFCVCCLGEGSCTGCCQQGSDSRSWIHVEAFVVVLTN